jgi:hypothetical protein
MQRLSYSASILDNTLRTIISMIIFTKEFTFDIQKRGLPRAHSTPTLTLPHKLLRHTGQPNTSEQLTLSE